jgi:hypothetical protein
MSKARKDRRDFLKSSITTAAAMTWVAGRPPLAGAQTPPATSTAPAVPARAARIKFAAIGLNHGHINGQVDSVKRGGGELVSFYAKEPDLASAFQKRYPEAKLARSEQEILEDSQIKLVVSASIPDERARQGLHGGQAGHDHARAARGGAQGPGGDQADLLDPL